MSTVCHPLFNKKGSRRKYIMYLLICAEETQEILETKETGYIQRMAEFRVESKEEQEWGIGDK